jgi:eukaryotic-like serine/threonine-protein kinase
LLRPTPFGKYLLLDRVNVGGMAEVFKAKHFGVEGFERTVALKRILANIAEDRDFIEMFVDEAKVASQLNHANIAQIFELGKQDGSYFIAMEYVAGRDLRSLFDRAKQMAMRVPMELTCYVMLKVCEGLDYAHNKKDAKGNSLEFIHRDVSPQNVMVSFDGDVKLIDFGLAKASTNDYKTQAGILKGKFGYMSPEQIMGLAIDRRSDVFSAGIVLYEMLTGQRAFYGESDFATLELVRDVRLDSPRRHNPEIPEALERIVMRALAKDRELRYQTAMDLHDDLQSFMYGVGSFFQRKDLAATMERFFAAEVAKERERDAAHRDLRLDSVASNPGTTQDMTKKAPPPIPGGASKAPPPVPPQGGQKTLMGMPVAPIQPKPAPVVEKPAPVVEKPAPVQKSSGAQGLEWDDDDEATSVFDRSKHSFSLPPAAPPQASAPATRPSSPGNPSPFEGLPPPSAPRVSAASNPDNIPTPQPVIPAPARAPSASPSSSLPAVVPMPVGGKSDKHAVPAAKSRGNGLLFLSAGIGILALAFGAFMALRPPAPATIQITTDPVESEVWIDGEIFAKSSPFVITGIDSRVPHLLEVRADGYKSYKTRIELTAGETKVWPHIALRADDEKPAVAAPAAVSRVVAVSFISEPPGAEIVLARGQERRSLGPGPVDAQVDVSGDRWMVEMRLEGFQTWSGPLTVPAGRDALALSASLKPLDSAAPVALAPQATAMRPAPAPVRPVATAPAVAPRPAPKPATATATSTTSAPPPAATGGTGTLMLQARPPAEVFLNGKSIGHTPIMNYSVPAGRHTLTFVNEQFNVRKTVPVTVAPDESVKRSVDLTEE